MSDTRFVDHLPGKPVFAWISGPEGRAAELDRARGGEVVLRREATILRAAMDFGSEIVWAPTAKTSADDARLRHLVGEVYHALVVVNAVKRGEGDVWWLQIRGHVYHEEQRWDLLTIGVDDRIKETIRQMGDIGGRDQPQQNPGPPRYGQRDVFKLLRDQLLLPPTPGSQQPHRVIAVASPGQELHQPDPCLLLGAHIAVALARSDKGWRISTVRRHSGMVQENERLVLVHTDIEFEDVSIETRLRKQMRVELDQLATNEADSSLLATWRRYREMENRHALNRMRAFHYLVYYRREWLDSTDEVVRLYLDDAHVRTERGAAVVRHLTHAVSVDEEIELECVRDLPEVLGGAHRDTALDNDRGLLDVDLEKGTDVGTVRAIDPHMLTLDLHITARRREVDGARSDVTRKLPPPSGFLHIAVGGDRVQLERRQKAMKRIMAGQVPLPQLLSLLQGKLVRGRDHREQVEPLSDAARAWFPNGDPTPSQTAALNAALNTPDIAVIQGPPGTGKTRVIFALQARLAEEGRGHAVISRSMLLTSFQHAAVDTLVEGSMVWDLPTIKIDSQDRGSTAHVDGWQRRTVAALKQEIPKTAGGRRTLALRAIAHHAAGYQRVPMQETELDTMLAQVSDLVNGLIPDDLLDQLEQLRNDITGQARIAASRRDSRRESVLRAVRGLRCRSVSFCDDGPITAATALAHLSHVEQVQQKHIELVSQAAEWLSDDPPPFLAELGQARDELIDQFGAPPMRLAPPEPRADVVQLLDAIVEELDAQRRSSQDGADLVLAEYLEDLQGDPQAVRSTLRLYTTSLGTTCQQADSPALRDIKDGELLFDTVIVDEAARVNPLDLLIPLSNAARRIVLVGDQNQLPHMLDPDVERELIDHERVNELTMLRQSVFAQLFDLLEQETAQPPRAVRLNTQFRMHPVLGRFVSRNFYQGALDSPLLASEFQHQLNGYQNRPAAWISVPHEAGAERPGPSKGRPVEARLIAEEIKRLVSDHPDLTFGVISFYSTQVFLLWKELRDLGLAERHGQHFRPAEHLRSQPGAKEEYRLRVGTVDAFQGKECDVVLLSMTRSSLLSSVRPEWRDPTHPGHARYLQWVRRTYGHLTLRNRLCVAMSRQQRLLVVVGDDALFESNLAPPELAPMQDFLRICSIGNDGNDGVRIQWEAASSGIQAGGQTR